MSRNPVTGKVYGENRENLWNTRQFFRVMGCGYQLCLLPLPTELHPVSWLIYELPLLFRPTSTQWYGCPTSDQFRKHVCFNNITESRKQRTTLQHPNYSFVWTERNHSHRMPTPWALETRMIDKNGDWVRQNTDCARKGLFCSTRIIKFFYFFKK